MSQRALISVVILFCLKISVLNAQVPTLDPGQTVNTATGAMGFTLPLGAVRGVNGHDFPVNLYYHAGIRLDEDASPAGLGFGYEAGVITKSPVFANDESLGKTDADATNYDHQSGHNDHVRDYNRGMLIARIATAIVGVVLSCIPGTLGVAGTAFSSFTNDVFNGFSGDPSGFVGGGSHMPQYQDINKGIGFFKLGGTGDLPDNYFINCPYLNGKMVWVGDAQTGHFVMQSTMGSSVKDYETVKIKRNVDAQGFTIFEITLTDGTRLFFEKYDALPNTAWNFSYYEDNNPLLTPCTYDKIDNKQSVPSTWHLTKVLFNDYTGSGNPLDPASNSKGSWLCFEYNTINQNNLVTPWQLKVGQGTTPGNTWRNLQSVNYTRLGGHGTSIIMNHLERIISPLDIAIYNYSNDDSNNRKDFLFFRSDLGYTPKLMPKLNDIVIKNNKNKILRKIDFIQDYSLRPCTFSALKFSPAYVGFDIHTNNSLVNPFNVEPVDYAANPKCGALSLKQIVIKDGGSNKSYPITLDYVNYPKSFAYRTTWQNWVPGNERYTENYNGQAAELFYYKQKGFADCLKSEINRYFFQEKRDYWGYYLGETESQGYAYNNEINGEVNNQRFILSSSPEYAHRIDDYTVAQPTGNPEKPWAANWSLNKISFPNGLSVEWVYEANRFNYANGEFVYYMKNHANAGPLYGGGIRVKNVMYTNGNGKSENTRYIYYNGYTPVMPYDYINDGPKLDLFGTGPYYTDASNGGLYTSAKVAYSKVVVAKNYQEDVTPHAPFG